MVGTSGSAFERSAPNIASGRSLAGLDLRHRGRDRRHQRLRIVAEHRGQRRAAAVGRQMAHLDAGRLHEQRHRNVQRAIKSGRTEDDFVRPLLGVVDEVLQRLVGLLVVDQEHARVGDEARDRDEIGAGEFQRAAEQLVDFGEAGDRGDVQEQRVAVGLGAGGDLRADRAGGAGLGFDHARLLDHRLHDRRERPADDVGCAAGRERIDEGDGVRRIRLLRRCGPCDKPGCRRGAADDEAASVHLAPRTACACYA